MKPILKPVHEHAYALLRIFTGAMFMIHGSQKILGFPTGPGAPGRPPIGSLPWVSGLIELSCGALVLLGLITTIAAFIASGEMAVAYFMVHARMGSVVPNINKGEMAVLYCFIFLYIAANGSGVWSIDNLIWGRRSTATVTAAT